MAYKMRISDWSSDRCSSDLAISDCRNALRVDFGQLDERFQSPCRPRHESGPVLKQFSDSRHHIVVVGEQRAAAMKIAGKGDITLRRQLLRAPFGVIAKPRSLRKNQHRRASTLLCFIHAEPALHVEAARLVMQFLFPHRFSPIRLLPM